MSTSDRTDRPSINLQESYSDNINDITQHLSDSLRTLTEAVKSRSYQEARQQISQWNSLVPQLNSLVKAHEQAEMQRQQQFRFQPVSVSERERTRRAA